jgi:hypothetical protein
MRAIMISAQSTSTKRIAHLRGRFHPAEKSAGISDLGWAYEKIAALA